MAFAPIALTASGGVAPYTWTVSSGGLPPGLILGGDGTISGTPTGGGEYKFTVQVGDSGGSTAQVGGGISIADRLSAGLVPACAKYCNVELGCVDACGVFGSVTGGVGPFTIALVQGPLPAGTSLSGLALTGTFRGLTGYLQFTVQVSDALGATARVAPTFWMYDHISLQGSTTCYGNYNTGCTAHLAISGGVPGTGVSVTLVANVANPKQGCWNQQALPPPAKSTLTASGGNVNVYIPPAPEPAAGGYGAIWTVKVTSTDPCGPNAYCTTNQGTVEIGVQCG